MMFGDFLGGAILGVAEGAGAGKTLVAAGDIVGHPRERRAGHHRFVGGDLDQVELRIDAVIFVGGQPGQWDRRISVERVVVNFESRRYSGGTPVALP